jgi:hypothetical protein
MRNDPFFNNTVRKPLDMDGETVEFPVLYYDFRFITIYFPAKTATVRRNVLPHHNFKPIEIWPGCVMIGITAFEYHDTSIGPYNEIAISVPIKFPPGFIFPFLTAIRMERKGIFPLYIHRLPVTTEIALKGGIHFWNFPKFMSDITFQDRGDNLEVTLLEKGEMILKLNSKKPPLNQSRKLQFHTYSIKDNVVMHGLVEGWIPKIGSTMRRTIAEIELGRHPIGKELADLDLGKSAKVTYGEGAMTKLHEPDQRWNADTLKEIRL